MRISDWSSDVCSSDLRLYLPEDWAADPIRRDKASVPHDVGFATKPAIALEQIRAAVEAELPRGVVLMEAGYGAATKMRPEKIGRTPGRERVCQEVWISVVGGTLKKKIRKTIKL